MLLLILALFLISLPIIGRTHSFNLIKGLLLNASIILIALYLIDLNLNYLLIICLAVPTMLMVTLHYSDLPKAIFYYSLTVSLTTIALLLPVIIYFTYQTHLGGFSDQHGDVLEMMSLGIGYRYSQIEIIVATFITLGSISEASIAMIVSAWELKDEHQTLRIDSDFAHQIVATAINTVFFGLLADFLISALWIKITNVSLAELLNSKVVADSALLVSYSILGILLLIPIANFIIQRFPFETQSK